MAVFQPMLATIDQYRCYRTLSKTFKNVVYRQLHAYLKQNDVFCERQCGFRKRESTVQALLNHTEFMKDSKDTGNFV